MLARPTTDMPYDGFRIAARLADGAPTAERCSRRARRARAPIMEVLPQLVDCCILLLNVLLLLLLLLVLFFLLLLLLLLL